MKKLLYSVIVFWLSIFSAFAAIDPDARPVRKPVDYTVRSGLPNFYKKLHANKDVRIAYFGGSITSQPGWRVHSLKYFQEKFPKANVSEIQAAIGGTGSELGAFRLQRDVLDKKPDLVFIEFAVNDSGAAPRELWKSIEGIIRHIKREIPDCDICLVYTITFSNVDIYFKENKVPNTVAVMEDIADYYKLPSINMGYEVAKLEHDGKLVMRMDFSPMQNVAGSVLDAASDIEKTPDGKIPFSKDGVHPFPNTGHLVYMQALARAFPEIEKVKTAQAPLPPKLLPDCWENTKSIQLSDPRIKITKGRCLDLSKEMMFAKGRLDSIFEVETGGTIEFKFKGTKLNIFDIMGPKCGYIEVDIDGKKYKVLRFDDFASNYRMNMAKIADNLEDKPHTVKISVLDEDFDKRKILEKRDFAAFDKRPKDFAARNFYPANIMIVGELLD